jgi:hypothetical protein
VGCGHARFAGEHASLYHAWIQWATESGLRESAAIKAESLAG